MALFLELGDLLLDLGTQPDGVLALHGGPEQYVVTVPDKAWLLINRHLVPGESAEDAFGAAVALGARVNADYPVTSSADIAIGAPRASSSCAKATKALSERREAGYSITMRL